MSLPIKIDRLIGLLILIFSLKISGLSQDEFENIKGDIYPSELVQNDYYQVEITNRTSFFGFFIKDDGLTYEFKLDNNSYLRINVEDFYKITEVDPVKMVKGKWWYDTPHDSYHILNGSAINLKKGEGYYQNNILIYNGINYGITDHFSLFAGMDLISIFDGNTDFLISPKLGNYKLAKNIRVGVSGIYFKGFYESLYSFNSVVTIGNLNNNISLGVGVFDTDSDINSENGMLTFSGKLRVAHFASLFFESMDFKSATNYSTVGVKLFTKSLSFSIGIYRRSYIESYYYYYKYVDIIPMLGVEYKF